MNRLAYRAGYKYVVEDPFECSVGITGHNVMTPYIILNPKGELTIASGYAWDGASGPALNTVNFRIPSLVHDALYQLIAEGLLPFSCRGAADDILITLCKKGKMWAIRRWWVKLSVNTFGARALENRNPVLFAPEK